jgi:hypothetical protein
MSVAEAVEGRTVGIPKGIWIPISAMMVAALMACSSDNQESRDEEAAEQDVSLRELVAKADAGEYQVTYEGVDAEGTTGRYSIAVKGDKTYGAFDFDTGSLGESGYESISIDDGTISYNCGDLFGIGGDGSEPTEVCYSSPSGQNESDLPSLRDLFNPAGVAASLADSVAEPERDGSEEIAGREGRCFKVDHEILGKGRACVDPELGIPLLIDATDPEGVEFSSRATDVKSEVDDSLFEPPYPVEDYPDPTGGG